MLYFFLSRAFELRLAPLSRDSRLWVATHAFESRLAPFSRDSRLWVATREARQLDYLSLCLYCIM